jgi:hypothetical protein
MFPSDRQLTCESNITNPTSASGAHIMNMTSTSVNRSILKFLTPGEACATSGTHPPPGSATTERCAGHRPVSPPVHEIDGSRRVAASTRSWVRSTTFSFRQASPLPAAGEELSAPNDALAVDRVQVRRREEGACCRRGRGSTNQSANPATSPLDRSSVPPPTHSLPAAVSAAPFGGYKPKASATRFYLRSPLPTPSPTQGSG